MKHDAVAQSQGVDQSVGGNIQRFRQVELRFGPDRQECQTAKEIRQVIIVCPALGQLRIEIDAGVAPDVDRAPLIVPPAQAGPGMVAGSIADCARPFPGTMLTPTRPSADAPTISCRRVIWTFATKVSAHGNLS